MVDFPFSQPVVDRYQFVLPPLLFALEVTFEVKATLEDEGKELVNPRANETNPLFNQVVLLFIECIVFIILYDRLQSLI